MSNLHCGRHLLIRGRVQGVWFRASARDEARRLGLSGWVRNLPDGRVEAVADGPSPALQAFIAWCHRGPSGAAVEEVAEAAPVDGELPFPFEVLR